MESGALGRPAACGSSRSLCDVSECGPVCSVLSGVLGVLCVSVLSGVLGSGSRGAGDELFTVTAVCFSEKRSKPRPKPPAVPQRVTGADVLCQPGDGLITTLSRLKERCRSRDALISTMRIRRTSTRALAARVQQSWWQGAATLPMCSAYALGGTNGPALIESCIL